MLCYVMCVCMYGMYGMYVWYVCMVCTYVMLCYVMLSMYVFAYYASLCIHIYCICVINYAYLYTVYIYIYWEVKDKSEWYTFGNQIVRRMTKGNSLDRQNHRTTVLLVGFSVFHVWLPEGNRNHRIYHGSQLVKEIWHDMVLSYTGI